MSNEYPKAKRPGGGGAEGHRHTHAMEFATMATAEYFKHQQEQNRHARQFLHDILAGGPQPYQVVYEQAVAQGISKAALMTAKYALNIRSTRVKKRHIWELRETPKAA